MSKEQLARKDADIIPIHRREQDEKEALREDFFQYSLKEGKKFREELGELNKEIAVLEEELEILNSAIAKDRETLLLGQSKKNQKFELTREEYGAIEDAITDLRVALRPLYERHFSLEIKITPDAQELMQIRNDLREEKRKRGQEQNSSS